MPLLYIAAIAKSLVELIKYLGDKIWPAKKECDK